MKSIHASRTIDAPLELVFQTIADIRNFSQAVPHITKVEFLSEQHQGVGTRFRETRTTKGREQSIELSVDEYVDNDRVRMVSDAGGAVWDTLFRVANVQDRVELTMQMDVKPHKLMARIMMPMVRGMVAKGVEADLDAVKAFCESQSQARQGDAPADSTD